MNHNKYVCLFYSLCFFSLLFLNSAYAADWPMFKHDVLRTSFTSENLNFPLEVKWTSLQTEGPIMGAPAVAGNKVYFRIDGPLTFAGYFYVLDKDTGSLIWKRITPGRTGSAGPTVTVANGIAYIGFNYYYPDGQYALWALDPVAQSIVRRYTIPSYVHSNPAIFGDKMYVASWSQLNKLWAFDINQVTPLWSYPAPGQFSDYVLSSPAVAYPVVFIGSYNGCMVALFDNYPTDVRKLWENCTGGGRIYSTPAIGAGKIYFGTQDGKIYCLDAGNGNACFTPYQTGGWVYSSPAIGKDKDLNDIVVVGSDDGFVYALYADTGALKWKFQTGASVRSSPAIAYDRVLFGSGDGNFYVVDLNTGVEVYRYNAGSPVHSSPAIANGSVYFGDNNGKFYALKSSVPPPPPAVIVDATPKIFDPSGDNDDNILGSTTISYELTNTASVEIKIYYSTKTFNDTTLVRTFPSQEIGEFPPPGSVGKNEVVWDGLRYDDSLNPTVNPHNKRKIVQEGAYTIKVFTNTSEFGSTTVDVWYHLGR